MNRFLALILAAGVVAGAGVVFAAPPKTGSTAPAPKTPPVSQATQDAGELSGKVVETMDAGGYTYVCLEKNKKKTWVAVPQTKVAMGSTMSFQPGAVMPNYTSPTLKRTFDSIVFSPGVAGGGAMPPGHPPTGGAQGGSGSGAAASKKDESVKVEKAAGANAYTVGEVHAKRVALNKKTVSVRGKVVKINKGIMDRNWIHIQDGTGDQKKSSHNLVATSQDAAAVGDTVTVTGVVAKDRDFGGGYLYSVILEDAKIEK